MPDTTGMLVFLRWGKFTLYIEENGSLQFDVWYHSDNSEEKKKIKHVQSVAAKHRNLQGISTENDTREGRIFCRLLDHLTHQYRINPLHYRPSWSDPHSLHSEL